MASVLVHADHTVHGGATRTAIHACHDALCVYGARRLETVGWGALGIGALAAQSPGFGALAWDLGVQWAVYDARDREGATLAEHAAADRAWFPASSSPALDALLRSRLALYVVGEGQGGRPVLVHLADGGRHTVSHGPECVLPLGATVVARVAVADDGPVALCAAVLDDEAVARRARGADPLDAALRQFTEVDQAGRERADDPALIGYRRSDLLRLCRALRALDHALGPDRAPSRQLTSRGALIASRTPRQPWTFALHGDHDARVERVPRAVAHPVDVEIMRQIGAPADAPVPQARGPLVALAEACAEAAMSACRSSGQRAA